MSKKARTIQVKWATAKPTSLEPVKVVKDLLDIPPASGYESTTGIHKIVKAKMVNTILEANGLVTIPAGAYYPSVVQLQEVISNIVSVKAGTLEGAMLVTECLGAYK